jgi:CubicO group peptidase (beta-lactamase class C family)
MSVARPFAIAFMVAVLAFATPGLAAPPQGLDARVSTVLAGSGAPGLGLVIVEDGKVVVSKGYGVRQVDSPETVDADTLFQIGSTGKAFTVADLAVLVDQGKLNWDDRVIDRLPGFQMYDPWVTREMTVRDLLVHRSGLGLGAGDLLFFPRGSLSRAETVRRLRFIKPATSFRSGYAYDNMLYMAAGQMIEAITGQTWEAFTRDHLLRPAGMAASTADDEERYRAPDRAQPHARLSGAIRGAGELVRLDERQGSGANSAPAGGISASPRDLGRWIQIQLAHGALPEGGRLFSEASSAEMWTPQTLIPIKPRPPGLEAATPQFLSYALGWEVRDWRGHKIVWHDGAVDGFRAAVVLIPERNTGFAIMINSEDGVATTSLMYELLDHYLDFPARDWLSTVLAVRKARNETAATTVQADLPVAVGPSKPLADYAGIYRDAWYGDMAVREAGGGLTIDFKTTPNMVGDLAHWRYDTFIARWRDKSIEPAYVTFHLGPKGEVQRVEMKAVSPQADFSYDYQDLDFRPAPATP